LRHNARACPQHAHEPVHAVTARLGLPGVRRPQDCEFASAADHDFGLEGQPAPDLGTQRPLADRSADDEGSGGADIDRIEVSQLLGQCAGLKRLVSTDVDTAQENDQSHPLAPQAEQSSSTAAPAIIASWEKLLAPDDHAELVTEKCRRLLIWK